MAKDEGASAFGRDLGYLDRFFDKLETHAATLEPRAASRLRALLAEERTRWAEIRALVGGGPAGDPPARATAGAERPQTPRPPGFTVGSLLDR